MESIYKELFHIFVLMLVTLIITPIDQVSIWTHLPTSWEVYSPAACKALKD